MVLQAPPPPCGLKAVVQPTELYLTRALLDFFLDPDRLGGDIWFHHPAIYQTTEPSLNPTKVFDSPGHELSEYTTKFYLNVFDDVTGQVKGQIVDYLSLLALAGKVAVPS